MKQLRGKYLIVVIALCGMLCGGPGMLINSAGVYFNPIAEELGIGRGAVSFAQTLVNIGFALGSLFASRILTPKTFRRIIAWAVIVYVASTAALSLAGSLPVLYAISCVRGLSAGYVGMVMVTTTLNNWFYGSAGFITSIVMGSGGIMAAVFSPLLTRAIALIGWRGAYVVNACLVAALFLPALLLRITYTPGEIDLKALGSPAEDICPAGAEKSPQIGEKRPSAGKQIDGSIFAICLCISFLCAFPIAYPAHLPGLADSRGFDASVGAAMLSVTMVMNTLGKLAFGALVDRIGNRRSMTIWFGAMVCGVLLMLFARSLPLLYVCAGFFGLGYTFTSLSNIILYKDLFGVENYSKVYPKLSLVGTLSNALVTSLVGFIYDATKSYAVALLLLACVLALTCGLVLKAYKKAGVK